MKKLISIFAAFVLFQAYPAIAADNTCPRGSAHCWYVIFGTGDAPARIVHLATRLDDSEAGNPVIEVAQGLEDTSKFDYMASTMEFDCRAQKYRMTKATAVTMKSEFETAENPVGWSAVPQSWIDRAYTFACDPQARTRPEALGMMYFLNVYRPADAVDFARRFVWQGGP